MNLITQIHKTAESLDKVNISTIRKDMFDASMELKLGNAEMLGKLSVNMQCDECGESPKTYKDAKSVHWYSRCHACEVQHEDYLDAMGNRQEYDAYKNEIITELVVA